MSSTVIAEAGKSNDWIKYLGSSNSVANDYIFHEPTKLKEGKPTKLTPNDGEMVHKHTLDKQTLIDIVTDIYNRCHIIYQGTKKEIILDNGNGRYQVLERNYPNFENAILFSFRTAIRDHEGDVRFISQIVEGANESFFFINLRSLFETIKTKQPYNFIEVSSIFYKENKIEISHATKTITLKSIFKYDFNIEGIDNKTYTDIVDGVNEHWQGFIPTLLDHMVASKYALDGKSKWLAILAPSNFGKSKLFSFLEKIEGSVFVKNSDLILDGISNLAPESVMEKMALAIDETNQFPRGLFEIGNYIKVRPMGRHVVLVPIQGRYFLTADGGLFSSTYIETQVQTRVAVKDLAGDNVLQFGDIQVAKLYGEDLIERVMVHWLYKELDKRLVAMEKMSNSDRLKTSGETLKRIFNENKMVKKNWFEQAIECVKTVISSPKETLTSKTYDLIAESLILKEEGIYIVRPKTTIPIIITGYDSSMGYELQYKSVDEIASKAGWQLKSFYFKSDGINKAFNQHALFIPKKEIEEFIESFENKEEIKKSGESINVNGKDIPLVFED